MNSQQDFLLFILVLLNPVNKKIMKKVIILLISTIYFFRIFANNKFI